MFRPASRHEHRHTMQIDPSYSGDSYKMSSAKGFRADETRREGIEEAECS